MLKFLNSESKTIVSAAVVVGALSFVSRFFGFIRDRILAGEFGAGPVLDAYYAAFKVPDFLFGLLVIGSLSASFIPIFSKYYYSKFQKDKAWEVTSNALHMVMLSMIVISVGLIIFAEPLAEVIAPGFEGVRLAYTVMFMRVMFLAQIILAASTIFGSVLQGMKRFFFYSLSPVMYNVGIIIGAVWLVDWLGPIGLAWGVVLGAFLHFLVQLYGVAKAGYTHKWVFRFRDKDTLEILKLAGPRMLAVGVNQITFILFTIIATTLTIGSVTIFQFAYNIQFFPIGIIGISYAIAAFPSFSEHLAARQTKRFVKIFSSTVRQVLFFMVPMMLAFLLLRAQIVRVVVGAGEFDWEATILTANTLAFFALSFAPQALVYILARAFFALRDTATPLIAGVVATVVGLMGGLWFSSQYGVMGLGMAFSLASIVNLALLWVPLRQRLGDLDEEKILKSMLIMTLAGLPAAIVMQLMKSVAVSLFSLNTFFGVLMQGIIAGGSGILVYLIIAFLLRSEELLSVLKGTRCKFFRRFEPEEAVSTEAPPGA